jgi:phosphatidylglycerophosphate synthase
MSETGPTVALPHATTLARLADVLTLIRLAIAPALSWTLTRGGWTPLVLFTIAAVTDYVDGPLARRAGRDARHGAILDVAADVTFVLMGLITAATLDLVSWAAPAAVVVSVTAYALASLRLNPRLGGPRLARSRLGHAAGVGNYVLVGFACGAVALPESFWPSLTSLTGVLVAVLNLAAVLARFVPRS